MTRNLILQHSYRQLFILHLRYDLQESLSSFSHPATIDYPPQTQMSYLMTPGSVSFVMTWAGEKLNTDTPIDLQLL